MPVARNIRELLPHIFTFSPPGRSSYFLWHFLLPACADSRPLAGMFALCCPDFPLLQNCSSDNRLIACKNTLIFAA